MYIAWWYLLNQEFLLICFVNYHCCDVFVQYSPFQYYSGLTKSIFIHDIECFICKDKDAINPETQFSILFKRRDTQKNMI